MKCEKCKITIDGNFGSSRFCSRKCANSRIQTKEINKKRSQSVKKTFSNFTQKERKEKLCHPPKFTKELREKISNALNKYDTKNILIKKKINNKCERCNSQKNLCCHHKDMNKKNNNMENLIIFCKSCHIKEHYKIGTKSGKMGHVIF